MNKIVKLTGTNLCKDDYANDGQMELADCTADENGCKEWDRIEAQYDKSFGELDWGLTCTTCKTDGCNSSMLLAAFLYLLVFFL